DSAGAAERFSGTSRGSGSTRQPCMKDRHVKASSSRTAAATAAATRAQASKEQASSKERPTVRKRGTTMTSGDAVGAADLARRIGQRLRDERTARDMSLDDLSRASGVSRAALSQIETRKSSPSIAVMWK